MKAYQVFSAYDREITAEHNWAYCPACGSGLIQPAKNEAAKKCANPGCGFVLYRNPVPIVAVLIVDGDKFLLCRRKPGTLEGGKWCLPCGYVEFHEDFLTASRREVKEETGLEVEITALLSVASNFLRPDIHTLAIALLAKPTGGVAKPGDDVDELGWFALDGELPTFAFPADRHMVERYFATRLPGAPVDLAYAGHSPA
jgi:8-oxo-dGTP diphosphatase